jgi:DNA helicase II / ATP-dependent DNA helicase PcrA
MEYRIFGPPGTGKTTELSRQIKQAVLKRGPDSVVVASFTRAAAAELTGRELPLNPANLGTLHSLCYRSMGCPPVAEDRKGRKLWNDWVREHAPEQKHFELPAPGKDRDPDDPFDDPEEESSDDERGAEFLQRMRYLRARMVPETDPEWGASKFTQRRGRDKPGGLMHWYSLWKDFKREAGMIDFTDMVEHGLQMRPPSGASVLFFDEAQDFSALELAVCRHWGSQLPEDGRYILAGDDDQAIYSFRGATPERFLSPLPEEQKRVLAQSYRLPSAVKHSSQRWISQLSARESKEFFARRDPPDDPNGRIVFGHASALAADYTHPEGVIDSAGKGGTTMILALCGYMLDNVIAVMRARGVPFHNPYRKKNGRWNPLLRGSKRLEAFIAPLSHDRLWTWGELSYWLEVVDAKQSQLPRGIKSRVAKMGDDSEEQDKPVTREDLEAVFGSRERAEEWIKCDVEMWKRRVSNPESYKKIEYPVAVYLRGGRAALTSQPKIVVGTIHSVKGGQADNVFLFPDLSKKAMDDQARVGHDGVKYQMLPPLDEITDATRRVFYVGMTRAKEQLVICYPRNKRMCVPLHSRYV